MYSKFKSVLSYHYQPHQHHTPQPHQHPSTTRWTRPHPHARSGQVRFCTNPSNSNHYQIICGCIPPTSSGGGGGSNPTNTPTPTPGPWTKLKNSSFASTRNLTNPIPPSLMLGHEFVHQGIFIVFHPKGLFRCNLSLE